MGALVLGAGLMGQWHADAISRSGGVVRIVCDPEPERARALAARHPGAIVASTLDDALRAGTVDVVHVCTPTSSHFDLVERSLSAALHVLVEKPLAPTAEETETLLGLAAGHQRLLCPVHQMVLQPGVRRAARVLADLGTVLHVDAVACSAGAENRGAADQEQVAFDILPHPISIVARLLPNADAAGEWAIVHQRPGELRAVGQVGGASVSILVSMRGRPTTNSMRIVAERGTMYLDLFHGYAVVERGRVSRLHKMAHPFLLAGSTLAEATINLVGRAVRREVAYPGLRSLVGKFYEAVRTGEMPPIAAHEIIFVARQRDRIIRRARATDMADDTAGSGGPWSTSSRSAGFDRATGGLDAREG